MRTPIISRIVTAKTIKSSPEIAEIIISRPALIPLGLPAEVVILTAPNPARIKATTAAIEIETVRIVETVWPPLSPVSNDKIPPIEQVVLQGTSTLLPPAPPVFVFEGSSDELYGRLSADTPPRLQVPSLFSNATLKVVVCLGTCVTAYGLPGTEVIQYLLPPTVVTPTLFAVVETGELKITIVPNPFEVVIARANVRVQSVFAFTGDGF